MDKLIHQGEKATVTNDGATIIQLLDVVHPAAKALADVAEAQDKEVGDGTTSVMILSGEFLKEAKTFIEDGMHSRIIIKGFRDASSIAIRKIKDMEHKVTNHQSPEFKELLLKCARTSLNSKLVASYKDFFADIVVDAVMKLDSDLDKSMIGIKHVQGGSVLNSFLVDGVAFKKTFSYAGFEQQPCRHACRVAVGLFGLSVGAFEHGFECVAVRPQHVMFKAQMARDARRRRRFVE